MNIEKKLNISKIFLTDNDESYNINYSNKSIDNLISLFDNISEFILNDEDQISLNYDYEDIQYMFNLTKTDIDIIYFNFINNNEEYDTDINTDELIDILIEINEYLKKSKRELKIMNLKSKLKSLNHTEETNFNEKPKSKLSNILNINKKENNKNNTFKLFNLKSKVIKNQKGIKNNISTINFIPTPIDTSNIVKYNFGEFYVGLKTDFSKLKEEFNKYEPNVENYDEILVYY